MERHMRIVLMATLSVVAAFIQAILVSKPWESQGGGRIGTSLARRPPLNDPSSFQLVTAAAAFGDVIHDVFIRIQSQQITYDERSLIFAELLKLPLHTRRRNIPRKGWRESPLQQLLDDEYPADEFKKRLRLSRPLFQFLVSKLVASGYMNDNECRNKNFVIPAQFKVAVAIYHLAYGGTWFQTGFAAGIAPSTAYSYTHQVCEGIVDVMKPLYMRKPKPNELLEVQRRFAARRGIANIGGAVDGTHVPWQPDSQEFMEDFVPNRSFPTCSAAPANSLAGVSSKVQEGFFILGGVGIFAFLVCSREA